MYTVQHSQQSFVVDVMLGVRGRPRQGGRNEDPGPASNLLGC